MVIAPVLASPTLMVPPLICPKSLTLRISSGDVHVLSSPSFTSTPDVTGKILTEFPEDDERSVPSTKPIRLAMSVRLPPDAGVLIEAGEATNKP